MVVVLLLFLLLFLSVGPVFLLCLSVGLVFLLFMSVGLVFLLFLVEVVFLPWGQAGSLGIR